MLQNDAIREQILSDPASVLDDEDVVQALIAANVDNADRKIVDLRGVLIDRLEGRLSHLQHTHRDVVAAAYENLAGTQSVHRAVLSVLRAKTFDEFLTAFARDSRDILGLEDLRLCMETSEGVAGQPLGPDGPLETTILALPVGGVAAYCGDLQEGLSRPVTLRPVTRAGSLIFGRNHQIRSEAVLRFSIGPAKIPAILICGSGNENRFCADQGTDLLTFFADVVAAETNKWLA